MSEEGARPVLYVILLIHNYKRDTNEDVHTVCMFACIYIVQCTCLYKRTNTVCAYGILMRMYTLCACLHVYTSYSVHVYTSEQTQCVLISTHLECNFSQ